MDEVLKRNIKKVAELFKEDEKIVKELWESQMNQMNTILNSTNKIAIDKVKLTWIGSFSFNKKHYEKVLEKSNKMQHKDNI